MDFFWLGIMGITWAKTLNRMNPKKTGEVALRPQHLPKFCYAVTVDDFNRSPPAIETFCSLNLYQFHDTAAHSLPPGHAYGHKDPRQQQCRGPLRMLDPGRHSPVPRPRTIPRSPLLASCAAGPRPCQESPSRWQHCRQAGQKGLDRHPQPRGGSRGRPGQVQARWVRATMRRPRLDLLQVGLLPWGTARRAGPGQGRESAR